MKKSLGWVVPKEDFIASSDLSRKISHALSNIETEFIEEGLKRIDEAISLDYTEAKFYQHPDGTKTLVHKGKKILTVDPLEVEFVQRENTLELKATMKLIKEEGLNGQIFKENIK